MASELKPCPFCGGQPSIHHGGSRQYPETFICCKDTECMGYHYPQDEQPGWNHDGTAEAWNKRVAAYTEADLAARVEAERVRAAKWCADKEQTSRSYGSHADAYEIAARAIRALGPTPAFDAAIKAAREDGMEAAVAACEAQKKVFRSHEYATPQPLGSLQEIFAVDQCIAAIRAAKDQPA